MVGGQAKDNPRSMPHRLIWQETLSHEMGAGPAAKVIQAAETRYNELLTARARLPHKALRQHLLDNILPGLALYRVLSNSNPDQDACLQLVERLFQTAMAPQRRRLGQLGRSPLLYHLIRWGVRPINARKFPPTGWQIEWQQVDRRRVAFTMHRCYYVDTLTTYDAPELAAIYCRLDDYIYGEVSPYIRWGRTQTLGIGGECCDFVFERVHPGRAH